MMKNKHIYESASASNIFLKSMETSAHMKRIQNIRTRHNKFMGDKSFDVSRYNDPGQSNGRANSPFNLSMFMVINNKVVFIKLTEITTFCMRR
jgi:hypothetical protein